jgi:hypothetical protein
MATSWFQCHPAAPLLSARGCGPLPGGPLGSYSCRVAAPTGPQPRITLVAKPGCHLCDEARAVIARVAADTGVSWEEASILEDAALAERYAEEIPVTLVDGRQHAFWRVDEDRLRQALSDTSRSA